MLAEPLVIPLPPQKIRQAAGVLAQAFFSDPFFVFTIPDPDRRRRVLPWLFERMVHYAKRYGKAYITEPLAGAALWLGPREPRFTLRGTIRTGISLLPLKLNPWELGRSLRLSRYTDALHKLAVNGQHWYLCALGVDPAMQGHGIGAALLQPLLEMAGHAGVPCYLDTNNENNVPFYQRCGFEVTQQGQADRAGPGVWGMLKKSQR